MMMNDNNNHYSDVFGDEIKNHRRKKGKGDGSPRGGAFSALKKMTINAVKLANHLSSDSFNLHKSIKKNESYNEIAPIVVPTVSAKPVFDSIDNFRFTREYVLNSKGQIIEHPAQGAMKNLIQFGQNSLDQDLKGMGFSTYSFKGWKVKLDGVFRFFDGSYHLLAISDDSNWLLRASIEQFFIADAVGDPEPIGLIYELARLYSITNGSGVTWDSNKKSLSLPDGLYVKVNNETENDDDQWQAIFIGMNQELPQIKREIIMNNFEERIQMAKTTFITRWKTDTRPKIELKEEEQIEPGLEGIKTKEGLEDSDSEHYEYVIEDMPRETCNFGSSRPLPEEAFIGAKTLSDSD